MYAAGKRFSLMGNVFGQVTAQHLVRLHQMWKGVIQNNTFNAGLSGALMIKLHAPCRGGGCDILGPLGTTTFSEDIVISDNRFNGGAYLWMVVIAAQNNTSNEQIRNIIVERNHTIYSGGAVSSPLGVGAADVTVRNNLFDMSNGQFDENYAVRVIHEGLEPNPTRVHIYNNTMYRSNAVNTFVGVEIEAQASNTKVKNNLAYNPAGSGTRQMILGSGSGLDQANNSLDSQIQLTDPLFVGPTTSPAGFVPNLGSYAINSGASVPVFSDFFRLSRPQGGVIDRGAFERP